MASPKPQDELAIDMLRGADEIALYIFGDAEQRRKIYHLVATSRLPVFKLGSLICARRSVLRKWVEDQEQRHSGEKTRADRQFAGKKSERHSDEDANERA